MKKLLFLLVFAFSMAQLGAQGKVSTLSEDRNFRIPLIGEKAPSFTAESTNGKINFPEDFGHTWKILFSHPQDFTPVCSTELLELAYLQDEFDKLGVKLAVISTDPVVQHVQWKAALESINLNNRGTVKIKFPIIADEKVLISQEYGMIHQESNSTRSVRGVFIIDPDNIIQAIYFYPKAVGRNTDELIRLISALKATTEANVLTPANWKPGNDVLIPYGPNANLDKSEVLPEGYYQLAWFMKYKKTN